MAALVFSLLVPAIVFSEYVEVLPSTTIVTQAIPYSNEAINVTPALEKDVSDLAPLLWGIYFLGVIFFGIKFIKNLIQIYRRIQNNPKQQALPFVRVLLFQNLPPHTFFKYIFLNKTKLESNQIPEEVILHEETHAKQKHSLDVLFIELLQIIMWFNPLIYFIRKSIKLNHEFLADQAVLENGVASFTYQNTLLSFMTPIHQSALANAINYSSIKKRFTVMKSQTSKKSVFLRSFLLLPLLGILLISFSQKRILNVYPENPKTIVGTWIEQEQELTELSIFKHDGNTLSGHENWQVFRFEELNGKYYHISSSGDKKPVLIDVEKGTLAFGNRKYIRKGSSLKEKLVGVWENKEEDVQFVVRLNGRELLWDVVKADGKVVRYYPKKQSGGYAFTYDSGHWSFEIENGMLYDSKNISYKRVKKEPTEVLTNLDSKSTDIVEQEPTVSKKVQDKATSKMLEKYNTLAKKYNKQPKETRVIPLSDLKVLEVIYRKMTTDQKKNALPFPECLPQKVKVQDGASRELMKEYNKLAKKYNNMSPDRMQILLKDVERLKYIYSLMSEKQKADAEPFPDFPPMPEPPSPPTPEMAVTPKTKIKGKVAPAPALSSRVTQEVIRVKPALSSRVAYGTVSAQPPSPPSPETAVIATVVDVPPPPPPPKSPVEFAEEMAQKNAEFYYNGKKITAAQAIEILEESDHVSLKARHTNLKRPRVELSDGPIKVNED